VSRAADRITVAGFTLGWSAVRRMPEPAAYALFNGIADAAWARRGKGVTRLESNLRRALGPDLSDAELRELSRAGMRSYMRYFCQAFRMPGWGREGVRARCEIVGKEKLQAALDSGVGAVVSLPHSGNWDLAGAYAAIEFGGVTTVAERLKPEELFEKFLAMRTALGVEVLPHEGGDVPVLATLADRVRSGRLVALLGDRDLSDRGVPVEFFGATTKLPVGPAAIALDTGALLFPGTMWFEGERAMAYIHDPIPMPESGTREEKVQSLCQSLAHVFEQGIREHPEDWHMLARVWVDPAPEPPGGERG